MNHNRLLRIGVLTALYIYFAYSFAFAQRASVLEQMRGVWVSTAFNLDWPTKQGMSAFEQQAEFIDYLDKFESIGINTVILQVRPAGDAIFKSSYEPWSKFISGKTGEAPTPYYDPLSFAIEECKARGMELHAWFNPFRAAIWNKWTKAEETESRKQVFTQHPDWFVEYGEKLYFDPGNPELRHYLVRIIMDVVRRYPVDGIHFDDYFYPFPDRNLPPFNDAQTFQKYGNGFEDKYAWRRENINSFIKEVHDSLQLLKPELKFGIGPPAVWRNQGYDSRGSKTLGLSAYDDLHADTRLWMEQGWIDYIAPQMYSAIGSKVSDYRVLASWWNDNAYGRHVYTGHALFRIDPKSESGVWRDLSQIPRQIRLNEQYPEIKGSVLYSAIYLKKNIGGIYDSLRNMWQNNPAIAPGMPWKYLVVVVDNTDSTNTQPDDINEQKYVYILDSPKNPETVEMGSQIYIFWEMPINHRVEFQPDLDYRVYLFRKNEPQIPDKEHLIQVTDKKEALIKKRWLFRRTGYILVTAVYNNIESAPASPVKIRY